MLRHRLVVINRQRIDPYYKDVVVRLPRLIGPMQIIDAVRYMLLEHGVELATINNITEDAMAEGWDRLLRVVSNWVTIISG